MKKAIIHAAAALALLAGACGGKNDAKPTAPHCPLADRAPDGADVDAEVARIFGDPPVVGRLPSDIAWSPDGAHLAYLRANDSAGKSRSLWVADVGAREERPIVSGAERPVDAFAWLGAKRIAAIVDGDLYAGEIGGEVSRIAATPSPEERLVASEDGARVAYVRDDNVYVYDFGARTERPVTRTGKPGAYFGGVTWLWGEEFATAAGLGFSPDGKRLWFYAVDETRTPHARIPDDSAPGGFREQAYPRPGEPNPTVRIGVADVAAAGDVRTTWLDTGAQEELYLPRVTWFPRSDRLAVIRLDRLQTALALLSCDAATGACVPVLEERDPRWVNLLGEPVFFDGGARFLWLSERDGFAHIYVVNASGLVERRLTSGDWTVSAIAGVDEKGRTAYFTANAETPISYGVYRVPLAGGDSVRVSAKGGVHDALLAPAGGLFADTHSALDAPPRIDVVRPDGVEDDARPFTIAAEDLSPYPQKDVANELYPIALADGTELWCHVTRPRTLDPDRRYPVVVYVYGGPGLQIVKDAFHPSMQPWRDALAARGFVVFSADNRGSAGRGRDFETAIHLRLGAVEAADQLAALARLKKEPYVDPDRVGVFGWSYGGTMALALLMDESRAFRAGAAVAPVVDWRDYDSAYTERYMQRPDDNPDGYAATSLLGRIPQLHAPLLLAHGLADDNVHFSGTSRFIDALVAGGKSFELLVYPGRSHGLRGGGARAHVFSAITRFFERRL
jgi:dipeptidyl-peptidase 4